MSKIHFHSLPDGRSIAYRHCSGAGPVIVFLPGYMSDMAGTKAAALFDWAITHGRACLLLDYSGCGESAGPGKGGDFADGSLSRWRDEVLELIAAYTQGPVLLVGSSMGGWLMLLAGRELAAQGRLYAMVGIAAAPDFTDWGFPEELKRDLQAGKTVFEDNPYGPDPTPTPALFWQDGEQQRQLDGQIPVDCPVRLLHGQDDREVPVDISLRLAAALRSEDVQITLVKGGDHRLSREEDIALLLHNVGAL
ncbi:MAG: alpha/beta fold hydrolase [Sphingomonadaceae bacterium]